jgi:hypothetical protein
MSLQMIVERANALAFRVHADSPVMRAKNRRHEFAEPDPFLKKPAVVSFNPLDLLKRQPP